MIDRVTTLLRSEQDRQVKQLQDYREQVTLSQDYEILTKYTNSVLSNKLEEVKAQIEPLLNQTYQTIFKEDHLRFELNTDIKRGKTTYSVNIINDDNSVSGLIEAHGGAVVVLTSVILRVIFLILTDSPRFIVLDESLNPISPKYREQTSEFLSEICSKLGFDIIVITFDENNLFSSSADTIYEARRVSKQNTTFKKIR